MIRTAQPRRESGVAMVAVVIVTMVVTTTVAAFLTLTRAQVLEARIQPARTRALYNALGELHQARLFVEQSNYVAGQNLILSTYDGGTIPGTSVEVRSMQPSGLDPDGIFYALRARGEYEGVTVSARQLVEERASLSRFFALVTGDGIAISGMEDSLYDPETPRPLPPEPLSLGRIHANGTVALAKNGWRHFLNPITTTQSDWTHVLGSQPGQQVFWQEEETRTSVPAIPMPPTTAFALARAAVATTLTPTLAFPDAWATGLARIEANGVLVSGPVDVSIVFNPSSFTLLLREQTGSHRVTSLTNLVLPNPEGVFYVETGTGPSSVAQQTVHVQGNVTGRYTVIAAEGDIRVAGDLVYVDANNTAAAILDQTGRYRANPAYRGEASIGLLAEFDVRYGIRPTIALWPTTEQHVDALNGAWMTTIAPGLLGQPVGPRGETAELQDALFGYLGGPSGDDPAIVHGAMLARTGRIYPDGLNPRGTTLAYRAAVSDSQLITPFARPSAALLRLGSVASNRQPLDALSVPWGGGQRIAVGWGTSQIIYDEALAMNAPPHFLRHDRPAFHPIEISDVEEIR